MGKMRPWQMKYFKWIYPVSSNQSSHAWHGQLWRLHVPYLCYKSNSNRTYFQHTQTFNCRILLSNMSIYIKIIINTPSNSTHGHICTTFIKTFIHKCRNGHIQCFKRNYYTDQSANTCCKLQHDRTNLFCPEKNMPNKSWSVKLWKNTYHDYHCAI